MISGTEEKKIVLGIGSNSPDAEENVRKAVGMLRGTFSRLQVSSVYPTLPEGDASPGRNYFNAVAAAETVMSLPELECFLKAYESANGRTAESKAAGLIPIDIDIVIYDGEILRSAELFRNYFRKGYEELTETRSESEMNANPYA